MLRDKIKKKLKFIIFAKIVLGLSAIVGLILISSMAIYVFTLDLKEPVPISAPLAQIKGIEISPDKKAILNSETKQAIFTVDDANRYLKDSGYAYDPDTFQDTNAKYAGDCFLSASLSNSKDRIVFSTGCLAGDLPQAWVGMTDITYISCAAGSCPTAMLTNIKFIIGGSGRNFVWSSDDKTITYEADLGLSGLTETRTIDTGTGEVLKDGKIDVKKINKYLTVIGGDIYCDCGYDSNLKIGSIDGKKINIILKDRTLSFNGDINKINLFVPNEYIFDFNYNGLHASDGLYRPNSSRSSTPAIITYKCDGPLVNLENIRYNYCETNGKDHLTQYEFSDLTSSGFGTGGGTSWQWYKLYIKKINGIDYIFQGYIDDDSIDGPFFTSVKAKEKYNILSSQKYLDEILADEENIKKIKEWDEFVENITFMETDETADWKTYRSEEYGFEVKYPKDWSNKDVFDGNAGVLLLNTDKEIVIGGAAPDDFFSSNGREINPKYTNDWMGVQIDIYSKPVNFNWSSWLKSNFSVVEKVESYNYKGLKGVIVTETNGLFYGDPNVFIEGDKIYNIRLYNYYPYNTERDIERDNLALDYFNQILSTFKFTE